VKRVLYSVIIACLALTLMTGVALAGTKKSAAQFPSNAKITLTSVPPFFYTFSWTAATGTFSAYRLDLTKTTAPYGPGSINVGLATRYTVETVSGEGYLYCSPGEYKVTVNAMSGGAVAASLALKGTVKLK
jgi:hypothetical protein